MASVTIVPLHFCVCLCIFLSMWFSMCLHGLLSGANAKLYGSLGPGAVSSKKGVTVPLTAAEVSKLNEHECVPGFGVLFYTAVSVTSGVK